MVYNLTVKKWFTIFLVLLSKKALGEAAPNFPVKLLHINFVVFLCNYSALTNINWATFRSSSVYALMTIVLFMRHGILREISCGRFCPLPPRYILWIQQFPKKISNPEGCPTLQFKQYMQWDNLSSSEIVSPD